MSRHRTRAVSWPTPTSIYLCTSEVSEGSGPREPKLQDLYDTGQKQDTRESLEGSSVDGIVDAFNQTDHSLQ